MSRLIDADESINRIAKIRPTNPKQSDYSHGVDVGLAVAMVAIEEQPTIESVRKGKWIVYVVSMLDGEDCKCSECGQTSCAPYWNFCPNCGSRMEGCEQDG